MTSLSMMSEDFTDHILRQPYEISNIDLYLPFSSGCNHITAY